MQPGKCTTWAPIPGAMPNDCGHRATYNSLHVAPDVLNDLERQANRALSGVHVQSVELREGAYGTANQSHGHSAKRA
jgi:hypothetical protein